jgi:hypothetical protein
LKRHGFSRAVGKTKKDAALAAEGTLVADYAIPQGLKPCFFKAGITGLSETKSRFALTICDSSQEVSSRTMRSIKFVFPTIALSLLCWGAMAQAATITGTVTNKTTGKPAAGDHVVLVDVQAGMSETAQATTDARGRYSLNKPGNGPALVRVTHQGAPYFIAAPEDGGPGDIPVYDVAQQVAGVNLEEDVTAIVDATNGQLQVVERYLVHNASSPPRTQWSPRSFSIVLPADAVVGGASAQRPTGLPTSLKMDPDGPKGHYAFNFPIQPDAADKGTLFQIEYTLPYSSGKLTFHPQLTMPARTVWVVLPKSMTFTAGSGSVFQSSPQDPGFQTFLSKNVTPGSALEFTISGTGALPREDQGAQSGQQAAGQGSGAQDTSTPGTGPGGGIGPPIDAPDPLFKYKGWILGGLALVMVVTAAFLLRRPAAAVGVGGAGTVQTPASVATPSSVVHAGPAPTGNAALLNALKEELFTLESDKIAGKVTPDEYAEVKGALETVLKRALKRS